MYNIYVHVLDTLADWELGYVTAELNSGRFFSKSAPGVSLQTVSFSLDSIRTMGGMTIVPDYVIEDMVVSEKAFFCCRAQIRGTTRNTGRSSKKQENFFPQALRCAPSAGQPRRLLTADYWINVRIPATDRDLWKWFLTAIKGRASMLTSHP